MLRDLLFHSPSDHPFGHQAGRSHGSSSSPLFSRSINSVASARASCPSRAASTRPLLGGPPSAAPCRRTASVHSPAARSGLGWAASSCVISCRKPRSYAPRPGVPVLSTCPVRISRTFLSPARRPRAAEGQWRGPAKGGVFLRLRVTQAGVGGSAVWGTRVLFPAFRVAANRLCDSTRPRCARRASRFSGAGPGGKPPT